MADGITNEMLNSKGRAGLSEEGGNFVDSNVAVGYTEIEISRNLLEIKTKVWGQIKAGHAALGIIVI